MPKFRVTLVQEYTADDEEDVECQFNENLPEFEDCNCEKIEE